MNQARHAARRAQLVAAAQSFAQLGEFRGKSSVATSSADPSTNTTAPQLVRAS
jgi:hypothetical protein